MILHKGNIISALICYHLLSVSSWQQHAWGRNSLGMLVVVEAYSTGVSGPSTTRSRFLSSFVVGTTAWITSGQAGGGILGGDDYSFCYAAEPRELGASSTTTTLASNPRYIQQELQMKYGDGPGKHRLWQKNRNEAKRKEFRNVRKAWGVL